MTERTVFDTRACTVYGYPSTGGVLIKEADLLNMVFLSLSRSHALQRAPSADEEDRFCNLLQRTGATFWARKQDWFDVQVGLRESTEEEQKVMVYGWPADGVGVWVLRFASAAELPRDFGRVSFAMDMEEKIQIMKEYGAVFVEDVTQGKELAGLFRLVKCVPRNPPQPAKRRVGSALEKSLLGLGRCKGAQDSAMRAAVGMPGAATSKMPSQFDEAGILQEGYGEEIGQGRTE
ncbi:hypothetical protein BDV11DRAFT_199837 [Aspergillus similis]